MKQPHQTGDWKTLATGQPSLRGAGPGSLSSDRPCGYVVSDMTETGIVFQDES